MKKTNAFLGAAVVMACLSSCASSRNAVSLTDISGEWDVIEIRGAAVVPTPGQRFPFIGFNAETGRVTGHTGCNTLVGAFDLKAEPGTIDLGQVGSTRMLCEDMTVERNLLAAFTQVKNYVRLDDEHIALCGKSLKRPVMVLQRKKNDVMLSELDGRWNIELPNNLTPLPDPENVPFVELDIAGKKLHGNAGCNIINSTIVTDEANSASISFSQAISTMMACPNMEVESRILKALADVRTFGRLAGGDFGFYDESDNLLLILKRKL